MTALAVTKRPAPPIYYVLMAAFEERRYTLGLSMEDVDRLAGIAERSYAKMIHPDKPSGRIAVASKLQHVACVLFPDGIERISIVPAERGSKYEGNGIENSDGAKRLIQAESAFWHRNNRIKRMREIGRKGGKSTLSKIPPGQRVAHFRRLAAARWKNAKHASHGPAESDQLPAQATA